MEERHDGFCIKSCLKSEPVNLEITSTKSFDFGTALESVYPLLEIVFGYLSFEDLKNVAKVKNSWRDIARKILSKRNEVSWITCFKEKKSSIVKSSSNFHFNNAAFAIILHDYRRMKPNKHKLCVHSSDGESKKVSFAEFILKEIVPNGVKYCLLSCPKVDSYLNVVGSKLCNGSIFDSLILPEIPGIRISGFHCCLTKMKKDTKSIKENILEHEEVQCLLLFALNDLKRSIYNFLDAALAGLDPKKVAVGGGIVRGTKIYVEQVAQNTMSSDHVFCVAFLKPKNTEPSFNASSVVIAGEDLSNEEFEKALLEFKNRIILRSSSVAFRICCAAKWSKEDESVLFRKLFPNTPLFGLEADGEIGWNSFNLPKQDDYFKESKPKKSRQNYPKVGHQWSTIIVFITWGEVCRT